MKQRQYGKASLPCISPSCLYLTHSSLAITLLAQVPPTQTPVPDKCRPRRSSVQTVLVQDNGVSSERCFKGFFFFAFLLGRIRGSNASKKPHEGKKLLDCLRHGKTKILVKQFTLSHHAQKTQICSTLFISCFTSKPKGGTADSKNCRCMVGNNSYNAILFKKRASQGKHAEEKRAAQPGTYLWILVHAYGEIFKSPLHVGMHSQLVSERAGVLTTQPKQPIICRKYISVKVYNFRFITGTENVQRSSHELMVAANNQSEHTLIVMKTKAITFSEEVNDIRSQDELKRINK